MNIKGVEKVENISFETKKLKIIKAMCIDGEYSFKADVLDKEFYDFMIKKAIEKFGVDENFEPQFTGSIEDCLNYNLLTVEEAVNLKEHLDKCFNK